MNINNSVLDILIDNCTNERLDAIIISEPAYTEASQACDDALQNLDNVLTPEEKKIFDTFTVKQNALSALYARLAYEQGMRDVVTLWNELTEK